MPSSEISKIKEVGKVELEHRTGKITWRREEPKESVVGKVKPKGILKGRYGIGYMN